VTRNSWIAGGFAALGAALLAVLGLWAWLPAGAGRTGVSHTGPILPPARPAAEAAPRMAPSRPSTTSAAAARDVSERDARAGDLGGFAPGAAGHGPAPVLTAPAAGVAPAHSSAAHDARTSPLPALGADHAPEYAAAARRLYVDYVDERVRLTPGQRDVLDRLLAERQTVPNRPKVFPGILEVFRTFRLYLSPDQLAAYDRAAPKVGD